jgi:hypothetical protein
MLLPVVCSSDHRPFFSSLFEQSCSFVRERRQLGKKKKKKRIKQKCKKRKLQAAGGIKDAFCLLTLAVHVLLFPPTLVLHPPPVPPARNREE